MLLSDRCKRPLQELLEAVSSKDAYAEEVCGQRLPLPGLPMGCQGSLEML